MTMNLPQCLHYSRVSGIGLSIASVEAPVQSLPQPPISLRLCLKFPPVTKHFARWLLPLRRSHTLPISLNSPFLLVPRTIYVHHHIQLEVCINPDKTCFLGSYILTGEKRDLVIREASLEIPPWSLVRIYLFSVGSLGLPIQRCALAPGRFAEQIWAGDLHPEPLVSSQIPACRIQNIGQMHPLTWADLLL